MDENDILDFEQSDEVGDVGSLPDETDITNNYEIEPYVLNNGAYGTISETYLNYFGGVVEKLPYDTHYVIWKSGDNSYTLAYGSDVVEENGSFYGDCDVLEIYRDSGSGMSNIWKVREGSDTLSLDTTNLFVYSDLGMYPTVERGLSNLEGQTILFSIGFAIVYCVCHDIFDYVLGHLRR